jgi:hypothetical protein
MKNYSQDWRHGQEALEFKAHYHQKTKYRTRRA